MAESSLLQDIQAMDFISAHEHISSLASFGAADDLFFPADEIPQLEPCRSTYLNDLLLSPYYAGPLFAAGYQPSDGPLGQKKSFLQWFERIRPSLALTQNIGTYRTLSIAFRSLYGCTLEDAASAWRLNQQIESNYSNYPAWYQSVMQRANTKRIIKPVHPQYFRNAADGFETPYAKPIARIDSLFGLIRDGGLDFTCLQRSMGLFPQKLDDCVEAVDHFYSLIQDRAVGIKQLQAYRRPFYTTTPAYSEARQAFPESVRQYHRRFKLGGYKMFLDGSPQGRTAWLRRPYQGEQEYRGYGTLTDAEVLDMVRRAGTDGMQLLAHCNGDAACAQYLAALDAAAREGVDLAALRPVMIHAQLLGRDQLPEVRRLGVIPSFFVAHVYHWGDVHLENLGPGRAEAISPAGSAAEKGIPFTFHQDAPVIRPDMLETVWCAVNRVTRQGRVLGREERVDVRTALEAVTVHAAYQYFEETDKGTLAPGKQADLVILDRDPLAVPQEELRDIRVLETWKDGVPIFCREA